MVGLYGAERKVFCGNCQLRKEVERGTLADIWEADNSNLQRVSNLSRLSTLEKLPGFTKLKSKWQSDRDLASWDVSHPNAA